MMVKSRVLVRYVLILTALLACLLLAWPLAGRYRFMPIHAVKVHGRFQFVHRSTLKQTLLPFVGAGFFHVNLRAATKRLNALPGVEAASIARVWPGTLEVHITEHHALANWGNKAIVDDGGDLFSLPANEVPTDLPLLLAKDDQKPQLVQAMHTLIPRLKPHQLALAIMVLDDHGAWHLKFTNGLWLHLGVGDMIPQVSRFLTFYPRLLDQYPKKSIASIDMNYVNAFALAWDAKPDQKKAKTAKY